MSKNGFFHARPLDYDIYVAEDMQRTIGASSVNWHVQNVRNNGVVLVADVEWNGNVYIATREDVGADHYWTIIRKKGDQEAL